MKPRALLSTILTAGLLAGAAAQTPTADLGAKFENVVFQRPGSRLTNGEVKVNPLRPLVGIRLSTDKVRLAVLNIAVGGLYATEFAKAYTEQFENGSEDGLARFFQFSSSHTKDWQPVRAFQWNEDKTGFLVILPPEVSYNSEFHVRFMLSEVSAPNRPPQDSVEHLSAIRLTRRYNASLSSDLTRNSVEMLTTMLDGSKRVNEKKESALATVKFSYHGVPDPLQNTVFQGNSFYDLTFDGKLTEQVYDRRSRQELVLGGVSDTLPFRIPGSVGINGFGIATSQSLLQTTAYLLEPGLRFGDLRGIRGNSYVSSENALSPIYFEAAVQIGATFFRRMEDVPRSQNRTELLLRPRATVGLAHLFKGTGYFDLTGRFTVYYVTDELGGLSQEPENRTPSVFDLTLFFGPLARNLKFSVSGGTNPVQNFKKIIPSYSLTLSTSF